MRPKSGAKSLPPDRTGGTAPTKATPSSVSGVGSTRASRHVGPPELGAIKSIDTTFFPPVRDHRELGFMFETARAGTRYSLSVWEGAVRIGPALPIFGEMLMSLSGVPLGTVRKRTVILSYRRNGEHLCEHIMAHWPFDVLPRRDLTPGAEIIMRLGQTLLEEVAAAAEAGEDLFDMSQMVIRQEK